MRRIRLTVAYDGTNYCGWQEQPNGITIEEVLNAALSKMLGEAVAVIGASRTDSGVHASGNVAVFDSETRIPPERISYALNQHLPDDIVIVKSEEVPLDWHPRYRDCTKTYEYRILNAKVGDPTRRLYTFFVSYDLDMENMRRAAKYLVGRHDFSSFCSIHANVDDMVRTVHSLEIVSVGDELRICITGNGFLYNMVRIIVGTLLRVGRGFYAPERVKEILETRNRKAAGVTVPPQGLRLVEIKYFSDVRKTGEGHQIKPRQGVLMSNDKPD